MARKFDRDGNVVVFISTNSTRTPGYDTFTVEEMEAVEFNSPDVVWDRAEHFASAGSDEAN